MEEMTLHAMSTEVALIMGKMAGQDRASTPKLVRSLENALGYLNHHVERTLEALPADRVISFVETALFCLVRHLPWRDVMDVARHDRLTTFCEHFGARASARDTEYRFDAA
jgi:hypothetical protein